VTADRLPPHLEFAAVCRDPIFVIGSPRSGTTAMGHALGRHPELWSSKESYVLHDLYGGGRANRVWTHHWERTNPSWLRAENVERAEFLEFLGVGVNAMYTSRAGGRRWVDPTPLNTPMVADLADMFPGASFVHLLRDGRFVVRSMGKFRKMLEHGGQRMPDREMPKWTEDFAHGCRTWAEYVEAGLHFAEANPARCVTVRHEQLADDPHATFARILEFLGASPHDGPAEFIAGSRINSSFQRDPSRPSDAEWSDWEPEQRETFARVAGPALVRAGFATAEELERWSTSGRLEVRAES